MDKAIIYARLSSSNQSLNNGIHLSIENQLNICNEYCKKLNFNVIDSVSEIKSGKNINKQLELQKIISENSNINVIFYNITRFSRNTGQAIDFINKCIDKKIKLHFTEENISIDHYMDMHRLRLGLSQAEYELNQISNRVKANNKILRDKGWKFGIAKYGKKTIFRNGIRSFIINNYEKEVINFIIMARVGDVNCKKLNRQLNRIIPNNNDPIEFWDMKVDKKINEFEKKYTLSFKEIAELLNSYNIKARYGIWNSSKVNRIYNQFCKNTIENKMASINLNI